MNSSSKMIARGLSRAQTSAIWGAAKDVLSRSSVAPSLDAATETSMNPRWSRQRTAIASPSPTPSSRSPCASALVAASSSANVIVPRSSWIAGRDGVRIVEMR